MPVESYLKKEQRAYISKHYKWEDHEGAVVLKDMRNDTICDHHDIMVKINIYEDRVKGWFLDIGHSLANDPNSEFVILQIAVSYIEGNQQMREGKFSHRKSEDFFARAAVRIFTQDDLTLEDAKILYEQVRCGLFHQGITKRKVLLTNRYSDATKHIDGGIYINSNVFLERVSDDLCGYLHNLRESSNEAGRSNFDKMFYFGQEKLGTTSLVNGFF
jgi:hypothetical protein